MKKNFLFKGVSILGAVMLLTNTMLPGLQVFADSEGLSAPTIEKIDITGWQEGDAEGIKTNHSKFDFDFEDDTLTIYDNGLESYKGGETDSHKYVGLLVDFGTTVKGKTNYNIEDGDKTDADRWGGNTESETDFVMRLSETKNGKTLTFEDLTDSSKTRDIKVVFKEIDADSVSFDKLTIPENATDTYIENITTNNSKFDFNYDSETNELSIMDNGLINYDNGHGENKWIGILADFGAIVEGVAGGYGVEEIDRTDATRRGADSDTEFVMWLSNARNNQDITLKKSTSLYNDDSITFKLLFKETVKFNSNGGSSVVDQMVVMGETATEPTTPTRSNYTFKGWFSDESLTTAYDFSTAVNDNITLYAKWEKKPYSSSSSSSSSPSSSNKTGNNNTGATAETGTTNTGANTPTVDPQAVAANGYTNEMNEAYEFAFKNGITTMKTIEQADMNGSLNRIAMAKMLSQYAINILKKIPDTSKKCNFGDVSSDLDKQYNDGVTLACQLGIMGVNITNFRPNEEVTKAEFGTALSRMLFGLADGTDNYYSTHLAKLKKEKIIINDDPTLKELRGYVMLMLMRSAK